MGKLLKIGEFSEGVQYKPDGCRLCANAAVGKGFCKDYVPENPIIAFLFDCPSSDDVIEHFPLSGGQGYHWQKLLIDDLGYTKDDVILSNVLRCKQPNDIHGKPSYPTGYIQRAAELNCRQYDEAIIKFDPNVFVITLHPRTIRAVGAHQIQIQRDVSKAFSFAKRGYRPAVLLGEGAACLYFPWMKNNGGMKTFRGHYWLGESPFKDDEKNKKLLTQKKFNEG